MKKLSKRANDFIELFFKTTFNKITLNRHDIDVLYAHYKYSWYEFDKMENENEKLKQELQRKNNIINVIKEELSKDFYTCVCKNKFYGKTFKAGAEVYKDHLLYKIKELENVRSDE